LQLIQLLLERLQVLSRLAELAFRRQALVLGELAGSVANQRGDIRSGGLRGLSTLRRLRNLPR